MTKKTAVHYAVAAAFIAASGTASLAFAIDEAEPNNTIETAQPLQITDKVVVRGIVGTKNTIPNKTIPPVSDVDFYSFEAGAGSSVTIDLDFGNVKEAGDTTRSLDAVLVIYDSAKNVILQNNDTSKSDWDPRLDTVLLPTSGKYFVGVTNSPRVFVNGGTWTSMFSGLGALANGTYQLSITGVRPPMQQITVRIKPGSEGDAPINPKSHGRVPVALMSSTDFDALNVDVSPEALTFGKTGTEKSLIRCNKDGEDVDGDGKLDLVCHFDTRKALFEAGNDIGIVQGKSLGKGAFQGKGNIKIVPNPDKKGE